jgi:hypothetical protein
MSIVILSNSAFVNGVLPLISLESRTVSVKVFQRVEILGVQVAFVHVPMREMRMRVMVFQLSFALVAMILLSTRDAVEMSSTPSESTKEILRSASLTISPLWSMMRD